MAWWPFAKARPKKAPRRLVAVGVRPILARYDAAQTTAENRRHWANADDLSAAAANSPEVRRVLRSRARYEVANNTYAKGMVLTLANDIVGTGPRLQMTSESSATNERVEALWSAWSDAIGLAAKLRLLHMARATDGEGFGLLVTNLKLRTPAKLDLRVVECDQFTTPWLSPLKLADNLADGIEFDAWGNPSHFHMLRQHPGDGVGRAFSEVDRIPAENVLHWFRADRPGQVRGIPDIMPAMPLFADLRRYTLAVVGAAEACAAIGTGVLETDAPADSGEADADEEDETVEGGPPEIELERGLLTTLPDGYKLHQLQAVQPTTTYSEFKRELLNEIARCLNMPFNIAAGNSSGYNYSSGRLDHQVYFKAVRVERSHFEAAVLETIWRQWLAEVVLLGLVAPPPDGDYPHQWFWDAHDEVDPVKSAQAQEIRLRNRTTSYAREYALQAQDWEEEFRQIAKEQALLAELGISAAQATPTSPPAPADQEDPEDVAVDPKNDQGPGRNGAQARRPTNGTPGLHRNGHAAGRFGSG